jgi:YidC/Oxa1 family membrane protein insertase
MNQTRTFLIFAWLMVAALLWMAWGQDQAALRESARTPTTQPAGSAPAIPQAPAAAPGQVPQAPAGVPAAPAMQGAPAAAPASAQSITVTTDALRLVLEGGRVRSAALLRYAQTAEPGSPPVLLFDDAPSRHFVAESGWVSSANAAPSHESGFVPEQPATQYTQARGADRIAIPFVWRGPDGVTIRRTYTLGRNDFAIQVRDEVINAGNAPWQGYVYRQLVRVPPVVKSGLTHPESYSFHGAAWYSSADRLEKRKFEDFSEDGALDKEVTGGWVAMLQHHFFSAWIPGANDRSTFSLATLPGAGGTHYVIREVGPGVSVAPGARAATEARLWVGPKLVSGIQAQDVPGLERAIDFSSYGWLAWIAELLFAVLSWLHGLIGNWGWAIVGLVVIVKALLFPLSAAQYKSAAKMRKFQPRVQQLKERYGDDKQKFQLALMELYKKEKINPVGGCLPVLLQMPIFLALYWTLLEAVELRHAPWIGWIQNLTAPDPYFILPVINIAVMWLTQKLTPMVGMDPMQQRMMQLMPLVFGVMMIFFPAGLVLYWVTNGALGLAQQWYMLRKYGDAPAKGDKPAKP